jgi:Uma2 family endonuclease
LRWHYPDPTQSFLLTQPRCSNLLSSGQPDRHFLTMTVATNREPSLHALPQPVTFDEFVAWYPENSEFRYELRRGVIVEMPKPRGKHSEVAGFSHDELALEIRRNQLPYFIPKDCLIKLPNNTGYEPDVVVLDRSALITEPQWQTSSIIENGASIKLAIEVVSTNWQDDYELKMVEYEALGIVEYWIIDYAAIGGIRHLGKPKQPTITIATLVDGEYEIRRFRDDDVIVSPAFSDLSLKASQIMMLG